MFRRVVLKLSGEALAGNGNNFDDNIMKRIAREVAYVQSLNIQVSLVIGGGNFWRGRNKNDTISRVVSDQIGMIATVMNSLAFSEYMSREGVHCKVMTLMPMANITHIYNHQLALEELDKGRVLIFAGGTAHPFFSTDSLVALRANELLADAVLYAKNIDGIYTKDPELDIMAKKYKNVSYDTVLRDKLAAVDYFAMQLSGMENIPSVVFGINKKESIKNVCVSIDSVYNMGGTFVSNNLREDFYE
jgi:uridylate kinase